MNLETKVGYKAVSILRDFTKKYIEAHTVNGKYIGDPQYLTKYQELTKYLQEKDERNSM